MRLVPQSLLWRTLWALVAALVLSQAASFWLFDRYITQPRTARSIGQFVGHLATLSAALQTLTPAQHEAFFARIAERDGIRISPTPPAEPLRPAPDVLPLRIFRERLGETFGPGIEVQSRPRDATGPRTRRLWVRLPAGERQFWVSIPRTRVEPVPATAFLAWGALGLAIAIGGTFFLMWHLNRPLDELARAAAQLGRGVDPPPVSETGPTEIRSVARAFNQMTRDLRKSESERATFLAGISHDLRTPLTRLRLDVEMLEDKVDPAVQRGMVSDLEDMNAIIDQFIDFMRSEAAEPLAAVDPAELARASADRAERSGARVRCEIEPVAPMRLRPLAVRRLLDNLLVNAARHGGGEATLRVRRTGANLELAVLDRGPGIPAEMAERLKQPFTRLDDARSGSSGAGLGLAIANRVAEIHGGRLQLLPREGGGLEARVTLPTGPS